MFDHETGLQAWRAFGSVTVAEGIPESHFVGFFVESKDAVGMVVVEAGHDGLLAAEWGRAADDQAAIANRFRQAFANLGELAFTRGRIELTALKIFTARSLDGVAGQQFQRQVGEPPTPMMLSGVTWRCFCCSRSTVPMALS